MMASIRHTDFKGHLLRDVAPELIRSDAHKPACAKGLQTLSDPLRDLAPSEAATFFAAIMTKETMRQALVATRLEVIPRSEALGESTRQYWPTASNPLTVFMP
jgi:hypothetical protein